MSHDEANHTDRRTFLQAGALATTAALGAAAGLEAQTAPAKTPALPKRKLGKTGVEMTLLEMGTGRRERSPRPPDPLSYATAESADFRHRPGVRDRARFQKWLEQSPKSAREPVPVTATTSPHARCWGCSTRLKALRSTTSTSS